MALLFMEGFDHYDSNTYFDAKWTGRGDTLTYATGRYGSGQYLIHGSPSGTRNITRNLDGNATSSSTVWLGLAYQTNGVGSSARDIIALRNGVTDIVKLSVETSGALGVRTGADALIASSVSLLTANTWFEIILKAVINAGSSTIQVWVDGVQWIASTATNLGSSLVTNVCLRAEQNMAITHRFDDIWLTDDTGSAPNNASLGQVKIETLFVTGDGTNTAWTASAGSDYQCVDETTTPNGDTDYISSATATDMDTFVCGDLSDSTGTVYGVQVNVLARKDDAGTRTVRTAIRQGSTDYDDGVDKGVGSGYTYLSDIWGADPTGSAWTISNVNADEYGVVVVA